MVRISYQKNLDNIYISNLMLCGSDMLFAVIHPKELTYEIRFISNDETVGIKVRGTYSSLVNCKRSIRKEFERLGVVFQDEVRNKI